MELIQLTDPASGSQAQVAAHIGFNCHAFQAVVARPSRGSYRVDVLDAAPDFPQTGERPNGNGIPLLFPFPNRIRRGRYTWADHDYQISADHAAFDMTGNAIHGFCLDRPWRVVQQTQQSATGEFQLSVDAPDRFSFWPCDFTIQVRYELIGAVLRADIVVRNPGDVALPFGFGTHPYFRVPLAESSDPRYCLIEAPVSEEWELIECLPTGVRRPVAEQRDLRNGVLFGQTRLDDVFTGLQLASGRLESVIMDQQAGLQITQTCSDVFRELVAYTPPDRNAVCLEPYTCVTDAINLQQQGLETGLRVLEPGHEFRAWIQIRAGLVLA